MGNLAGFDANKVASGPPVGEYVVVISKSETKATKAGNGTILKLQLQIVEGQYKGQMLFESLNIINPNQDAQRIALSTLKSICKAVGVDKPEDSSALHNRPMRVTTKLRDDGQTAIKSYKAVSGGSGTAQPSLVEQAFEKSESKAKSPWE